MAFVCPNAADWGDIATWIAGLATLAAVIVALVNSTKERRIAADTRASDQAERERAKDDTAVALAIVFDHELFMLLGQMDLMVSTLDPSQYAEAPKEALQWMAAVTPRDPLPLLNRFMGDLQVFGRADAAVFLQILSMWNSMSVQVTAEFIEQAPTEVLVQAIRSLRRGMAAFVNEVARAREITQRWARPIRDDLPPNACSVYLIPANPTEDPVVQDDQS